MAFVQGPEINDNVVDWEESGVEQEGAKVGLGRAGEEKRERSRAVVEAC